MIKKLLIMVIVILSILLTSSCSVTDIINEEVKPEPVKILYNGKKYSSLSKDDTDYKQLWRVLNNSSHKAMGKYADDGSDVNIISYDDPELSMFIYKPDNLGGYLLCREEYNLPVTGYDDLYNFKPEEVEKLFIWKLEKRVNSDNSEDFEHSDPYENPAKYDFIIDNTDEVNYIANELSEVLNSEENFEYELSNDRSYGVNFKFKGINAMLCIGVVFDANNGKIMIGNMEASPEFNQIILKYIGR